MDVYGSGPKLEEPDKQNIISEEMINNLEVKLTIETSSPLKLFNIFDYELLLKHCLYGNTI